jgi:hypothetical protein
MEAGMRQLIFKSILVACMATVQVFGADDSVYPGPHRPTGAGTVYVLTQDQSVAVTPAIRIKLVRINDSRCKQGAVCVWPGYISYTFSLIGKKGSSTFVLAENMPGGRKSITRQKLMFTLVRVDPEQPPAVDAPTPNYRVSLRVDAT